MNDYMSERIPQTVALAHPRSLTARRLVTAVGLLVGALGIAILWAAGVTFPVAVPPGILILGAAAALVLLVRRRWSLVVGALTGLFVLGGFIISPDGFSNLAGHQGAAIAVGQAVQVAGVATAAIVGAIAVVRGEG